MFQPEYTAMRVTYGKGFSPAVMKPFNRVESVQRLEDAMINLPPIDFPVKHYFAPGMYAREITIPKDTVLIGAVHRTDNLVVLSAGTLRLVTDDGVKEISAPCTLMCKAGTKNAAVAIEDAVWTNFFPTTETDLDKLVEQLTFSKADELMGGKNNKQLLAYQAAELLKE